MSHPSTDLKRRTLMAFVLPTLAIGFMHGPEGQVLGIYAKYGGVALTALAGASLLTRLFDAITYPLIGYLSDRSFARSGTRRYWIMSGAILSTFGIWFLYRPPLHVTVLYYGAWMAVTYVGWKVAEIPYQAWSYGLSRDYAQRARIQGWRQLAQTLGSILFFTTPAIAAKLGYSNTTELNFGALGVAAVACAFVVPLTSALALWLVPEGEAAPAIVGPKRKYGLVESVKSIASNGAMVRLLLAFVPLSVLTGMASGVIFLFMTTFLGLSKEYSTIALLAAPMALIGVPFWTFLCMRFERHHVLAASMLLSSAAYAGLSLVNPGPSAAMPMMLLFPIISLCMLGVVTVYSMTADAADYGRLQTGKDHGGLYASVIMFVVKSLASVSSAAGIAIIGWFGFDATAAIQTASGAFGMKLVAVYLPAVGMALVTVVIWKYPLNKARLADIRAQLVDREHSLQSTTSPS